MNSGPAIILVNPQMGENIGAAARAMLNCGLTDLRLVKPRDGWPNEAALANASGAVAVVENARLYESLADAVGDCSFVIATTARARDMIKPVFDPEQAAAAIIAADRAAEGETSALVFGPERTGLVNDDLTCCDAILHVPLNPDYSSLNIAQAVLLVAYQWYRLQQNPDKASSEAGFFTFEQPVASKQEMTALLDHLAKALDDNRFFTTEQQRPNMLQTLRNVFQRMRLSSQEAQIFHGILKALRHRS